MTEETDIPEIGVEALDAVLRFLPIFAQPGYSFGEWHAPEGQFPFYAINDEVMEFYQILDERNIIIIFNWPAWQEEGFCFVEDPELLNTANLFTLRKLITIHVRKDRFVEGHLAAVLENGHIVAILRRMQVIRETMGPPKVYIT